MTVCSQQAVSYTHLDVYKRQTLDRSFELYNQGLTLIKECNEKLDYMEKQIKIIERCV